MSARDDAWKIEAEQLHNEDPIKWNHERLGRRYGKSPGYIKKVLSIRRTTKPTNEPIENLPDLVLKQLQKEQPTSEVCKKLRISERILTATLDDLKESGFVFVESNGLIKLYKNVIPSENTFDVDWNGDQIIRFGVTSDNHLCNKMSQVSFLHHLYDIFEREGIKTVYNVGDCFDGYYKNRPEHIFELIPGCIGADEQVQYVANNYPRRKGITTEIIGGNHCATHIKNGGHDVVKALCNLRDDMKYLGFYNAVINLTPNCKLELNHPLDGSAFSLSYSIQRYIDSMMGGNKPSVLLNAHHHKLFYMIYRNIHAFETGCTEAQTGFMKGKRIAAHVGGIIIELHVDKEGTITRCKNEFIPCYKMLTDDWGKY